MKFRLFFYFIKWSSFVAVCLSLSTCDFFLLELRPADPIIYKNQTIQFKATVIDLKGRKDVTSSAKWESSDTYVASIDTNGKAVALQEGKTTITVTYSNQTQKTQLSVVPPRCITDLSDWKMRYTPNSNCSSCHTTCVNFFHCLELSKKWRTTNCQQCHVIDLHVRN